jgi:hypothetical protein
MLQPLGSRKRLVFLALISMLVVFSATAICQGTGGSVTGSVQDTTSSSIVGAAVKLINNGTAAVQTTTTDNSGNFQLLAPRHLRSRSVNPGFRTFCRDGIVVEADRSLAVPVTLATLAVTDKVEVVGGTPCRRTSRSARSWTAKRSMIRL